MQVGATGMCGPDKAIDLTGEVAVRVAVESKVARPEKVELPVVGVDHIVQQCSLHGRTLEPSRAIGCIADLAGVSRAQVVVWLPDLLQSVERRRVADQLADHKSGAAVFSVGWCAPRTVRSG
jgi:hypothetical protein